MWNSLFIKSKCTSQTWASAAAVSTIYVNFKSRECCSLSQDFFCGLMGWWAKSGTAHNQHATYTRNSNLLRPKTYKKIVDKGERMITSLFYKLRLPRPKKRNVNLAYVSNNPMHCLKTGPCFTWNYIILEFLSIFWKYFFSLLKNWGPSLKSQGPVGNVWSCTSLTLYIPITELSDVAALEQLGAKTHFCQLFVHFFAERSLFHLSYYFGSMI